MQLNTFLFKSAVLWGIFKTEDYRRLYWQLLRSVIRRNQTALLENLPGRIWMKSQRASETFLYIYKSFIGSCNSKNLGCESSSAQLMTQQASRRLKQMPHLRWTTCVGQQWGRLKGNRNRQQQVFWLSRQETSPSPALSSFRLEYVGADHIAVTVRMKSLCHRVIARKKKWCITHLFEIQMTFILRESSQKPPTVCEATPLAGVITYLLAQYLTWTGCKYSS